jgi:Protein of unknown function (DUF3443)
MLALCAVVACSGGSVGENGGPPAECSDCSGVDGTAPSSGSSSGGSSATVASNQTTLTVDAGPNATGDIDIPYVTVTLCQPNANTCATIDNVLVDTGSYGLRILASVLTSSGLNLTNIADPTDSTNTIAECVPFASGYTWGPMAAATIQIGGETATSVPINVLNDDGSYNPGVPSGCTALTVNKSLSSIQDLHANGILGVGILPYDCGGSCAQCATLAGGCSSSNTFYYSCNSTSGICSPTQVALNVQARNPVVSFATNNNGVILQLPAIASSGVPSAVGSMTFGIGTQSNNGLGSAGVLTLNREGFFTTMFDGQTLDNSFIDSGSNAYYFPDESIPTCSANAAIYCPSSTLTLSAVNLGQNGSSSTVAVNIANPTAFSSSNYAFDDIGGTTANSSITDSLNNYFDFGLPFFFGRSVFVLFDGATVGTIEGPAYAY